MARRPVRSSSWLASLAFVALAACGSDGDPSPDIVDARLDATAVDAADLDAVDCTGANECFSCRPDETIEFLNACTDGTCFPFDNGARLSRYNNGNLPPLP